MTKPIETLTIGYTQIAQILAYHQDEDWQLPEGVPPLSTIPKYYFQNALGDYVFIRTRDRGEAQKYVDEEYGGRYTLRTWTLEKGNGSGCKATETRKGQAKGRNPNFGLPRGIN